MNLTEEEIKKSLRNELEEVASGLDFEGFEIQDLKVSKDLKEESYVTVKFKLHVVPEDNYCGFFVY